MDPLLNCFSKDVAVYTLSKLDSRDLCNCRTMNHAWKTIATEILIMKDFPQLLAVIPKDIKAEQYFSAHAVSNLDELTNRIQDFINRVKFGENHSLTCFFPTPLRHCVLNLEFGYYDDEKEKRKEVSKKEYLVFAGTLSLYEDKVDIIEEIHPHSFTRGGFGVESRLIVNCRLISRTEQFINKIGGLPQENPEALQRVKDNVMRSNSYAGKKKSKGCIIA